MLAATAVVAEWARTMVDGVFFFLSQTIDKFFGRLVVQYMMIFYKQNFWYRYRYCRHSLDRYLAMAFHSIYTRAHKNSCRERKNL